MLVAARAFDSVSEYPCVIFFAARSALLPACAKDMAPEAENRRLEKKWSRWSAER